ncbi:Chromosome transmission fidelity protein 18 [Spiromyces aspiralis]|uniref:Chromosome transmission fidelity protein 18 n=1 Tax=Spiromyces aspiralis TaxID=68401 RepID=A0ACC1HIV6_9FUNG|nr:Chromosome transmission fidelity protein 18 [Spiromyces aspiralis]
MDKVMQGCFENYLDLGVRDPTHTKVASLTQKWLHFYDALNKTITRNPGLTSNLWEYLAIPLVAIHRACASPYGLSTGRFRYPNTPFEVRKRTQTTRNIIESLLYGARNPGTPFCWTPALAITDLVCWLVRILSPKLVTANLHLIKGEEQERLERLVDVMIDWGLTLVQSQAESGQFVYSLDPQKTKQKEEHLKKLFTPATASQTNVKMSKPTRDFFGRIIEEPSNADAAGSGGHSRKKTSQTAGDGTKDEGLRPSVWFYYNEGFSNAVRHVIKMSDLF